MVFIRVAIDRLRHSLKARLILSFSGIILAGVSLSALAGILLIGTTILRQAQDKVRMDLNGALEIYQKEGELIGATVGLIAQGIDIEEAATEPGRPKLAAYLEELRVQKGLDILTLADPTGRVLVRSQNLGASGDLYGDDMAKWVQWSKKPMVSTEALDEQQLRRESPALAERARVRTLNTPRSMVKPEADETAGLVLKVAAPVLDEERRLTGIVYGGKLLNNETELVDRIKNVLYRGEKYRGRDIGTTTIFLDDYRIATTVLLPDSSRAIGTRASKMVYQQVMGRGNRWIGRALVVNDWCIAAYEPLRNIGGKPVGMVYVGMLEAPFVRLRNQVVLIFLGIALVAVASLWLLANVTADRITRPLRELVRGTTQVASGDLTYRVPAASEDELGQLARSFNQMTEELRKATDGYQELTRTLEQKVADRTAELQAAQAQLIQNEKLSSLGKMAAGIAHEINNPLTSILLNGHLIEEKLRKDSRLRENLQLIIDETTRCGAIVKGLLEFSRQSISDKKPADINRIVKTTIQLMESQLMLQKVQATTALDLGVPAVVVDANKLKQVFTNLILNAADAMPGGGTIVISTTVDREARQVVIAFKDSGGGIPVDIQGKIFDPFFSTKGTKGTGLGLAISYGIIQQHGGTIEARSSEGQGTTMTVHLPIDETEHKEQHDG